jgi:DNA polymerase-3 subunit epsilon
MNNAKGAQMDDQELVNLGPESSAAAVPAWWEGPMVGFDLETTHPNPFEARIVTAAIVCVEPHVEPIRHTWVAAPDGWEIPDEAAEIHGYTTERAQAEGRPWAEVVEEVAEMLAGHASVPLVIYNARYDLTVLAAEMRRLGLSMLPVGLVVDPRVIDPVLDRYRRSYPTAPRGMSGEAAKAAGYVSTRTLEGMCGVYGATLDGAHDASFDALAACRLAYRIGQRGQVIRRVRNAQEGRELAALKREWEEVRYDIVRLFDAQTRWALAERVRFAEYKRSIGEDEEADRIESERGWPILDLSAHEVSQ